MKKEEKKVFAKDLKVGDNLIYGKAGSRYGLQSIIQEVGDLGLTIRVRIIGNEWLEFNCDDEVSLQLVEPFDGHTLKKHYTNPQTFQVGNFRVGIE